MSLGQDGAGAELRRISDEVVRVVQVMDEFNRFRFATDAAARAGWASAREVLTHSPPSETRPAQPS